MGWKWLDKMIRDNEDFIVELQKQVVKLRTLKYNVEHNKDYGYLVEAEK